MSAKESISAPNAWEMVVDKYREVCLLRREAKFAEADRMLKEQLPGIIATWSAASAKPITEKKAQLETMFAQERKRVDDALMMHRLVSDQLNDQLIPAIRARVSEELRTMVTEQMREIQAPQRVEAKGASRSISSFEPEAPALAAPATSIGIPLPAAIASRRKPNFNIVRAV